MMLFCDGEARQVNSASAWRTPRGIPEAEAGEKEVVALGGSTLLRRTRSLVPQRLQVGRLSLQVGRLMTATHHFC